MRSPKTPPSRRSVVLRASRDTLALVACTVGATLTLAYAVRQRPAVAPAAVVAAEQVWTGQLAGIAPEGVATSRPEAMTSASLVVPETTLALPTASAGGTPPRSAKAGCDQSPCPSRAAAPMPPARQKLGVAIPEHPADHAAHARDGSSAPGGRRFALSDLNPLPHLPDAVRKPFNYAGSKIAGLIDWF